MEITTFDLNALEGDALAELLEREGYEDVDVRVRYEGTTPVLEVEGNTSPDTPITEASRSKIERLVGESAQAVAAARAAEAESEGAREARIATLRAKGAARTPEENATLLDDLTDMLMAGRTP